MPIYVPGSKVLQWNIFEISYLSIRSGAHKPFGRFLDLSQFVYHNFVKIVTPSSDENEICVVHLKECSLVIKSYKSHQNRSINLDTILVQSTSPTRRQTNRDKQTP